MISRIIALDRVRILIAYYMSETGHWRGISIGLKCDHKEGNRSRSTLASILTNINSFVCLPALSSLPCQYLSQGLLPPNDHKRTHCLRWDRNWLDGGTASAYAADSLDGSHSEYFPHDLGMGSEY